MKKLLLTLIVSITFFAVSNAQDAGQVIVRQWPNGNKLVLKNGKWGLLGPKNEIKYPFALYDSYKNYNNGLLRIKQEYPDSFFNGQTNQWKSFEKMKYGLMSDRTGEIILPPVYNYIDDFANGRAIVSNDSLSGMINDSGRIILPIVYKTLRKLPGGNFVGANRVEIFFLDHTLKQIAAYRNVVRFEPSAQHCLFIYITKDSETLVDCDGKNYGDASWRTVVEIKNEHAFVRTAQKGYLVFNTVKHKTVLSGDFDTYKFFDRSNAFLMAKDSTWTIFDLEGKKMGRFTGTDAWHNFGHGFFMKRNGLWGYTDKNGNELAAPQWKGISPTGHGPFQATYTDPADWKNFASDGKPKPPSN
jgi:hypothetical protein